MDSFQLEGSSPFSLALRSGWDQKATGANVTSFTVQLATSPAKVSRDRWGSVTWVVALSAEHNEWAYEQAQSNKLRFFLI